MRILVVNWLDRENPRAGGAELHLHETFGRLAARGHSVTALVSGWPGCPPRAVLDGIEIHRAGGRHTFAFAGSRYFRRVLGGRPFDVVVEDLNKIPVFTPRWSGTPTVLLVHHLFGSTAFQAAPPPVALVTWLLERTVPRAYRDMPVVAVSESTRDDLIHRGLDASRITVVPNGIDIEHFTPGPPEDRYDEPTLVFLGRLSRYKRLDLVLQAVSRMSRAGQRVRLLVAGAGGERKALEDLARRLGITEQARFLGFVSEELKLEILRRSWIHVLTSSKEGWGLSNLEAAACATPTVASDAPGLRESVVDGETGVLVPHGDVAALTSALTSMLADGDARSAMGIRARRFAEGFTWDASARGVERVLARVVGHAGVG